MATDVKPTKPTTNLDFRKVFSSNSPIQRFTWTATEYLKGWAAIEMTPPARQQFDALQAHSDEKENWLYQEYLEKYVDKYLDFLETEIQKKGLVRKGKWYYVWGNGDLYFQNSSAITDSSGIATIDWPISFPEFPDGSGCYICHGYIASDDGTTASFGFASGQSGHNPDFQIVQARDQYGNPLTDTAVYLGAFGMKPNP